MPQVKRQQGARHDLHVMHAIPGRIRLRARTLYGLSHSANETVRKLTAIRGVRHVEANPTTGSLTMHYDHTALESVGFLAEVAAALGLIAEGIDPSTVKTLFNLVGVSPADLAQSLDRQHMILPIATFALGLYLGRQWV